MLARLGRLLRPTEAGVPWAVVLMTAALLGGFVTCALSHARLRTIRVVLVNVVLFGVFVFIYVGGDIAQPVFPPLDVVDDVGHEMGNALSIFRSSLPPSHRAYAGDVGRRSKLVPGRVGKSLGYRFSFSSFSFSFSSSETVHFRPIISVTLRS